MKHIINVKKPPLADSFRQYKKAFEILIKKKAGVEKMSNQKANRFYLWAKPVRYRVYA